MAVCFCATGAFAQGLRYDSVADTTANIAGITARSVLPGATITVCGIPQIAATGASESTFVVTITTTAPHGLLAGQSVIVSGVGVSGYNGTWTIATVPTSTTFTYNNVQSGLSASGGGYAITNAKPCTNTVSIYSDPALTVALPNPITADSQGNFGFWVSSGTYAYTITGTGIAGAGPFFATLGVAQGGSLGAKVIEGTRYVDSWGAVGNGVIDNLAFVNAACADAAQFGAPVHFPPGNWFISSTPASCAGTDLKFDGDGTGATTITLGSGAYLVDDSQRWNSIRVHGIKFEGGAGAIRNRYSGVNVNGQFDVSGNWFHNYTVSAVSHNSSDMPYWKIKDNIFQAANSTSTIAVALAGIDDTSTISGNAFINNFVHLKLGQGGEAVHVENNEFLEFGAGTNRAAIWVVPNASGYTGSGSGLTISHNKFGSENQDATDKRILYADQSTGSFFGDTLYATTASTGFISSHDVHDNAFNGAGSTGIPIVYTYTPNLAGNNYGPNSSAGTPISYIVQYDASILPLGNDTFDVNNIIGPIKLADPAGTSAYPFVKATNGVGAGWIKDDQGDTNLNDPTQPDPLIAGTGQANFANLQTGGIGSYGTQAGVTFGLATDAVGGTDAIEAIWTGNAGVLKTFTGTPVTGVPIWVDFEVKAGSSSPLGTINLEIFDITNGKIVWQRLVNIPAAGTGWARKRIRWIPRSVPVGNFNLIFSNNSSAFGSGSTGKVQIGRVVVYQSYEPLAGSQFMGVETYVEGPAPTSTSGSDACGGNISTHTYQCSLNGGTAFSVTQTVGTGNVTTAGTAVVNGTSQAQTGITVTGALTTDSCTANLGAALPATWQTGIQFRCDVTASDTVTVNLMNPTAGSITPAATQVKVRVTR